MKLLVCVILCIGLVAAQTLTEEQETNWKKWSEECRAESGIPQEMINNIRNNQLENIPVNKLKIHGLCFGKKSNLILENNEINTELVRHKLNRIEDNNQEVERVIKKCVVKYETPGETAIELFKCLKGQKPKFLPV